MTFEEVKNSIQNNSVIVDDLFNGRFPNPCEFLDSLIKVAEISNTDSDDAAIQYLKTIDKDRLNSFLRNCVEIYVEDEMDDKDLLVMASISLLLFNINSLCSGVCDTFYVDTLTLLSSVKNTLKEQISLNFLLIKKLESIIVSLPQKSLLSEKYYEEYKDFLNQNRINNSSSYSF